MKNKHCPQWLAAVSCFICSSLLLFFPQKTLLADVFVIVNPHAGGQELDFGQVSPTYQEVSKEADVEIQGSTVQYEIRQEPLSGLRNAKGDEIPWSNFFVRGLQGTNRFGRLKINPEPVTNSVIYTANQAGSPDSFTLVYTLSVPSGTQPDFYRGQLRFTFIPVSSSQASVSAILNIVATVKTGETQTGTSLEIKTVSGSSIIYLNSKKEEEKRCDVEVKINGNFKKPFAIKQALLSPLESAEGNTLGSTAVNVEAIGASIGTGLPLTALSDVTQVIYQSKPTGEADESFVISYSMGDSALQRSGRYRSRIQYAIEEMGLELERKVLELEIENVPVFDLIITPQEDVGGIIEFHDLKPGEGVKRNEVVIEIKTNTGKKYQVNQNVIAALTDKDGHIIEPKYFTMKTEGLQTKGELKVPDSQEVKAGDAVLFVSDNAGSPDKFKIIYELASPEGARAGDYSTKISYSLVEI